MNKNNYEDEETRKAYYAQATTLMQEAWNIADTPEGNHVYSSSVNSHLCKYIDLFFPLKKELWPEKFQNLKSNYLQIDQMKWPDATTYLYMYDVIVSAAIPHFFINFGYAFVEDKLVRTTFFVIPNMTVEFQEFPQTMVIDPLAEHWNIQPLYYVGCNVPEEYIQQWIRDKAKNPLELYIAGEEEKDYKKRMRRRYDEQIQEYPNCLSDEIIEFAKKEGLSIPSQRSKNNVFDDDDDDEGWAKREAHSIIMGSLRPR